MPVSYRGVSRRVSPSDSLFVLFQDNANGLEDPLEDVGVGVFGQEVEEEGVAHVAPTQHRVYHVTIRLVPHTSFPPEKKRTFNPSILERVHTLWCQLEVTVLLIGTLLLFDLIKTT